MSTDDLDDRIRALVRDAVFAAPGAPELPAEAPAPAPDRRRWVWAGVGVAASLALLGAALAVSGDNGRTSPVGPTDLTSTTVEGALPWPEGVAVLVASDRGIERITAEDGQAVVTRVLDGVIVQRAFELPDGLIVYQRGDGDIRSVGTDPSAPSPDRSLVPLAEGNVLEDADLGPDGYLQLVYRTAPSDPTLTSFDVRVNLGPDANASTPADGAWAVSYGRISIVDDTQVIGPTLDDTLQRLAFGYGFRKGPLLASQVPSAWFVAGDGDGSAGWIDENGHFATTGARPGQSVTIPDLSTVTDIDLRTNWLTVQRDGTPSQLVDLSTDTFYDLPVATGWVSVSRAESFSTLPVPSSVPTPDTGSVVPTSEPVQNNGFGGECMSVGVSASDLQVALNPTQAAWPFDGGATTETIEVAGRPATLYSGDGVWAVSFGLPSWCADYYLVSGDGVTKDEFLAALSRVKVFEDGLPEDMAPVLLWGNAGAAVVAASGTTPVTDAPVDDAVMLRDGRVVFHSPDLADFQMWDPTTRTTEPIWAAVDFAEQPVLRDAYLDTFVFTVGTNLYRYDTGALVLELGDEPIRSISMADDGAVSMFADPGATDVDSPSASITAQDDGNSIQVVRNATDVLLDWAIPNNATVVSLDIRGGWVVAGLQIQPEQEGLDGAVEVRMIDIATGTSFRLAGQQAHLG